MVQKKKIGKARKDKFYQLAKESGYRARSAFKLLQLNRTYRFLEKSRICIDLCAAPGGWLQVAATHMPTNRIIIGVDLVSIRPINNVITHVSDITTEKCRTELKKDLNDQKADCVLHDGAPNVGKNWIHDAYQQNMLVLKSFQLASEFLKKGGWFITKVFRSKDYYSVIWVFQQFFKKVEATKPQASRNESAEIFVVCQDYKAPDRIDPKFFDIKFVFSDVENTQAEANKKVTDLFKGEMGQRHRGGYADGDYTLYHKLNVSEFLEKENFIEILANSNEIVLDDERVVKHPLTTTEMKECFKDIKVLGKNEIKNLLKWRLKIKEALDLKKVKKAVNVDEVPEETVASVKVTEVGEKNESDLDNEEDQKLEEQIKDALHAEKLIEKKKKRKALKEKRKIRDKINMQMENPNDKHDIQGDNEVFSLNKIRTKKVLMDLQGALPGMEFSDEDDYDKEEYMTKGARKAKFSKEDDKNEFYASLENSVRVGRTGLKTKDESADELDLDDAHQSDDDQQDFDENEFDGEENPLLDDLNFGSKSEKKAQTTDIWFSKDSFSFLNDTNEENNELLRCIEMEEEMKAQNEEKKEKALNKKRKKAIVEEFNKDFNEAADNDNDIDYDDLRKEKKNKVEKKESSKFEVVKLNAEELALGQLITNSKKAKNELIDDSYNRYSKVNTEENLPEWFLEDEEEHFKKPPKVSKAIVHDYKKRFDDINARPIKKVVEAEARKKRRLSKKLERARKKTEQISNNTDMTEKEKNLTMKSVYKRAGLLTNKKPEVKYVVSKKGQRGKQSKYSGPVKLVDKRMKMDRRGGGKIKNGNKNGKPTKNTPQKKKGAKSGRGGFKK